MSAFKAALGPVQRAVRARIVPLDALVAAVPVGADVLEIGCGEGLVLERLLGRADRLVGIDIDERKLALLHRLLPVDRVEAIAADAFAALAAHPAQFDVVILADTLSSFPPQQQRALLDAAVGALRPGGRLLLKAIDAEPTWKANVSRALSTAIYRWARLSISSDQRFWYLPSRELAEQLRRRGLDVDVQLLHVELHLPVPHYLLRADLPR